MARRKRVYPAKVYKDPKFDSQVVGRLISKVMKDGKRSLAERIVYAAIDRANEGTDTIDPLEIVNRAIENAQRKVEGRNFDIRKQLLQRNFHQSQLRNLVQVTDSEVDNHLALYGKKAGSKVVTQTKARHILLRPGERLSNATAQSRLNEYRDRVLAGESFDALARAHSDDTASALKGGDHGWLDPDQGSPEFRRVMNRIKPGEISRPFKTPFGWHIVKVEERRKHESANSAAREEARQEIQQRKIEENLDLLIRRLRDQAYVENRLRDENFDF